MSAGLDRLERGWEDDGLRRAASLFGLACACMPVLDVCEQYSVVPQIAVALQLGALPAIAAAAWLWLLYFTGLAALAAALLRRRPARARGRLFLACALVHGVYLVGTGLRPAGLLAIGMFAAAFVALKTCPEGQPPDSAGLAAVDIGALVGRAGSGRASGGTVKPSDVTQSRS